MNECKKRNLCEPGWVSDAFDLHQPELSKLVTTVKCDDEGRKFYTIPVGQCNQLTTFEGSKFDNELLKVFPYVEEMTKLLKKEPIKKSTKKPKSALIVPVASILKK